VPPADDFDAHFKNVAFSYDNAVVLLAYLARGTPDDLRRAALIADAFVYAQDHDRFYSDGRLRNAYQAGDLRLPPGWTPNNRAATARMPGFWNPDAKAWIEDLAQVGSDSGNMGWIMLALLRAHRVLDGVHPNAPRYLEAAKRLGAWVSAHAWSTVGPGGFTGGYEGWEPTASALNSPARRAWKSTEHNIDLYVAFMTLADLTTAPENA